MSVDGYEDFFKKREAEKTVKNFLDFEKEKNLDIEAVPEISVEQPDEKNNNV